MPPPPDQTATLAPRSTAPTEDPARPTAAAREAVRGADDPERYEPVNEHARGGLGRVVRAVDRKLGRTVAVKELLRHDPSNEARFLREAMITARLEHPGIVPVHEAGRWPNGDPYYVMKLVEGRTLKELIGEHLGLRERLGLLPNVIAVADAVGYAHSEGVIHRDLKPSNIIVGAFGETIVVDWGLARDRSRNVPEPSEDLISPAGSGVSTVSGKIVGTPAYMSPEQARGDLVDERADVYALGAVLYEVLAGSPPHADTTPQATLDRVIAGPPCPLAQLVPSVPGELATIVHKAMARDPQARYPNAVAFAEDLRRFTTGKLVSAHSYSTWALLRKRLARHRGVVAVVVASLLLLGAVGVASFRRVVAERNIARSQREVAEDALASAEKRKRELVLLQAQTALPRDPTAALAWLKTYDVGAAERSTVIAVIDEALALGVARHVFRPGDWVLDAQFTPDGTTLVTAVRDGVVRAYDLATGRGTELGHAPSGTTALALSPDGELAITGGSNGEVMVWPLHGGGPRRLLDPGGLPVSRLSLSPDGRLLVEREREIPLAVALEGGAPEPLAATPGVRYLVAREDWSRVAQVSANELLSTGRGEPRTIASLERAIRFAVMAPRGDVIVVHDGRALWAVPFAGGPARVLARYDGEVTTARWAPDRRVVAIGGSRPEIVLVDTATGEARELHGHTDAIYSLEYSRDGESLLSASDDGTARVWRIASRTAIVLRGHEDDVYRARFSPDERSVATSSVDGSARVWQIERSIAATFVEAAPIEDMRLDGDQVATRTATSSSRWNLASGERERAFSWSDVPHHIDLGVAAPDGERVAVARSGGGLSVFDRAGHSVELRGHTAPLTQLAFSRDSRWLYSSSTDGTLRRWSVATGAGSVVLETRAPLRGFSLARDGRIAAQTREEFYAIARDGQVRQLGKNGSWCVATSQFESVRDRLLIHRCDGTLAIVDDREGDPRVLELPTGGYAPTRVAASPDGRWLAAGVVDRTVRLWSAETGELIDVLRGHADLVLDVAFSPDSRALASASYDKTIRVWDLESRRHRVLRGHAAPVNRVAWHGGGEVVTSSADGTVRLWTVPGLMLPAAMDIARQLEDATTARIDRDRPASGDRATRGT